MISFLDLKAVNLRQEEDFINGFKSFLNSGQYILGSNMREFEQNFAAYCGVSFCAGVASGLDALSLILRAMDIGDGDEVIVPANTYIATILSITANGATPVIAEPDIDTYNIAYKEIEALITPKTKAVMVVHLYGRMCDMEPISRICNQYGLKLIEDCAQAHGAEYKGKKSGSLSNAAAFSFYPGKNLGALGDGGAVVTNNLTLSEKVRILANYGSLKKYEHIYQGCNSRLDEMQAAFLSVIIREKIWVR